MLEHAVDAFLTLGRKRHVRELCFRKPLAGLEAFNDPKRIVNKTYLGVLNEMGSADELRDGKRTEHRGRY